MNKLRIAIAGFNGRMGQMLQQSVNEHAQTTLTLAIVRTETKQQGDFAYALTTDLCKHTHAFDILIDFTSPEASLHHAQICAHANKKIIIGTTGFNEAQKQTLQQFAEKIPMVFAPNMSFGVNLCFHLLHQMGKVMQQEEVDVEIVEMHHRYKKDAPSGTALSMGEAIATGMEIDLQQHANYCREGIIGERKHNSIGFQSLRGGDVIGDHSAIFALNGERIEITHKASNRRIYADGAVKAACWLHHQVNAGLYSMQDVIMD